MLERALVETEPLKTSHIERAIGPWSETLEEELLAQQSGAGLLLFEVTNRRTCWRG